MSNNNNFYSFINNKSYSIPFGNDGNYIYISRVDDAVSSISIKDIQGKELPIPKDFILTNKTSNTKSIPFKNLYFFICWSDSYSITYNGSVIIEFNNSRQIFISSLDKDNNN